MLIAGTRGQKKRGARWGYSKGAETNLGRIFQFKTKVRTYNLGSSILDSLIGWDHGWNHEQKNILAEREYGSRVSCVRWRIAWLR
jgi:hypothetical protein